MDLTSDIGTWKLIRRLDSMSWGEVSGGHTEHIGKVLNEQAIILNLPVDRIDSHSLVLDDNLIWTSRWHGSMVNLEWVLLGLGEPSGLVGVVQSVCHCDVMVGQISLLLGRK